MTIFRGCLVDTPANPFAGAGLRVESDGGLLVRRGVITERGRFAAVRSAHPAEPVVHLRGGLLLPGLIDSHVHFPQVRTIGALGMPLLEWLDRCALPEEAQMADRAYARGVAAEFVAGLTRAGTTTALVFGAHFPSAVDMLFAEAADVGLRIISGLVVSDRGLRPDLLTDVEVAHRDALALIERWHGVGRARYAVIPRFALSCSEELLAMCGGLLEDVAGAWFTTHLNESKDEVAAVRRLFAGSADYLWTYEQPGLVGRRSVFAHNVHPTARERALLADRGASVAHCPTSNAALGSGMFALAEHADAGVRVALGSDVGAGTGLSLLKEGLQAYFTHRLLDDRDLRVGPEHLLHLATTAGAGALGLDRQVGDLSPGKQFDAIWVRPAEGTVLDTAMRHAASPDDALAAVFATGTDADIRSVWIAGEPVVTRPAGSG